MPHNRRETMDFPVDPEVWFIKGDQLPTPEERLKYYLAGLKMAKIFRPYAWRGIGNARQDLGDKSGGERAYERAADAAIETAEARHPEKEYPPGNEEESGDKGAANEDDEEDEDIDDEYKKILGKCPKCGLSLAYEDIQDIAFRGFSHVHTAYVCRKCKTIIGFSATRSR